eukprot:g981.t1
MQDEKTDRETGTDRKSRLKRLGRGLVSLTTFSVNVGLAAAAVVIGVTTIQMRAEEKPSVEASPIAEVQVFQPDHQSGYAVERSYAGRLEPARQTDLAFELSGTVLEIAVDEGDAVGKGDIIARLDTRSLEAERRRQRANRLAVESDRELAELTLTRRQKLQQAGHTSTETLDQARLALSRLDATLAQIDAAIEAIEINLDKSVLRAPFAGNIGARVLDEGATVAPGQPALTLLESARPQVRIGLPPKVAAQLEEEQVFHIRIGSKDLKAEFIGLRPDLQTRTRTIEALFQLEERSQLAGFGDLAELTLAEWVESDGYWVPMNALKEGPRGLWTVLAIAGAEPEAAAENDAGLVIIREAVEVLYSEDGRAYVRGTITPDTRIVAAGVHRVVAGQEDPTITNIFASVTTVYPGADPARVEALVTEKIEEQLREVEEIDTIESTSGSSISIVQIELLDTLSEDVIEQAWSEIRDKLADAAREFPQGAGEPEFDTDGAGAFASISALVPAHDTVSEAVLLRYAEALSDTLRNVPGTKQVEIFGGLDEEILVKIDPVVLTSLSLTADQVSGAIRSADAKVQAGRLRSSARELLVEVDGEIEAIDRVRQIPLTTAGTGLVARVGDVATVTKGVRQPAEELAFADGRPAILVAAKIADGLQVDAWMDRVSTRIAAFETELPHAIEHRLVFDQSTYTIDRLSNVGVNIAIGMALVVIVLLVTMGLRSALIVAMVLPVVTLASFATMSLIGLPLHQMSLTGMIVALGLLVDAGIVMTDEIGQALERGLSRRDAVGKAVHRLFAPLLASTVTTALSFMPMVLLPGPPGDFVGAIAIAVIVMLLWSFVVAITLTAAVAGWLLPLRKTKARRTGRSLHSIVAVPFRFSLKLAMRNPASAVAYAMVLPVVGFLSMPTLTAQFFPGVDRDQFHIEVELADGTAISETSETALAIDRYLADQDGVEQVAWVIGKSAPAFYYNIVGNRDRAPAFAQALVTTASPETTASLVPDLQTNLARQFPAARILVRDLVQGPPVDAPVELRLVGPSLDVLRERGDALRQIASGIEEVTVVRTTLDAGPPKLSFAVNEDKARLLGLGLGDVARQLEATLEGATGGSLIEGTEELPIRVRVGDGIRGDLSEIASLPLLPPASEAGRVAYQGVPLSAIAQLRLEPAKGEISRRNGERTNTVQAFVQYGVLPEEALKKLQLRIQETGFALPDGYRIETGGDSDARGDTLKNLIGSLGLIVPLSIAAIVLTFNSFRLSAVTFAVALLSAGLSILALAVFQFPFGINAIIGVIGSIGVSINAAIIILTGMQEDEGATAGDRTAMVDVVMRSSRHIISTTLTTFGGFLPLILGGGGFWPPFAMSIAGGVLLSTVISFYFAPPMFALVYARKNKRVVPATSEKPKQSTEPWSNDNLESAVAAE